MTPKVITISLLLLAGCPKPEAKTPIEKTPESQMPEGSESQPIEATPDKVTDEAPPKINENAIAVADLPRHIGETVTLIGKITDMAQPHTKSPPSETRHDYYFNIEASQIVLYTVEPLACGTTLEVTGTVREVPGAMTRAYKAGDARYNEYHLVVSSWRCLDNK